MRPTRAEVLVRLAGVIFEHFGLQLFLELGVIVRGEVARPTGVQFRECPGRKQVASGYTQAGGGGVDSIEQYAPDALGPLGRGILGFAVLLARLRVSVASQHVILGRV